MQVSSTNPAGQSCVPRYFLFYNIQNHMQSYCQNLGLSTNANTVLRYIIINVTDSLYIYTGKTVRDYSLKIYRCRLFCSNFVFLTFSLRLDKLIWNLQWNFIMRIFISSLSFINIDQQLTKKLILNHSFFTNRVRLLKKSFSEFSQNLFSNRDAGRGHVILMQYSQNACLCHNRDSQ